MKAKQKKQTYVILPPKYIRTALNGKNIFTK